MVVDTHNIFQKQRLFTDQLVNFFFKSVFCYQFKNLNPTYLTNSMHTIGRLIFSCSIPPAIIVDHN